MNAFSAVKISDRVFWVGARDWTVRNFHGYATSRGTTYNAFLVMGEKPVLIDTVKAPFLDEMLQRISSVMEVGKISAIISNHSEMDHSGCIPQMIQICRPEKVYASPMGVKALNDHFRIGELLTAVSGNSVLQSGDLNFRFHETRMLHWPDSMITYLDKDKILFSQDGFGMHLASSEMFSDELDPEVIRYEAGKYFANILMPYSPLVSKLLSGIPSLGLDIEILAPDHGPLWKKKDIHQILSWYDKWAVRSPENKLVIAYDTMWGSTALMARAIAEGAFSGGTEISMQPLSSSHRSDVMTELLNAGAFAVGSPTMNNNMYPSVADLLTYVKGLKPAGLAGQSFGSYGWGGEASSQINSILDEMRCSIISEPLKIHYVPSENDLTKCFLLGKRISDSLKETLRSQSEK